MVSASPRRKKILHQMGFDFDVMVSDVEEVHWNTKPEETVRENARRKCEWCCKRFPDRKAIAADTVVVFQGDVISKPKSFDQAYDFLRRFSGKEQHVYTGVAIYHLGKPIDVSVTISKLRFNELTDDDIRKYFSLVDPLDKAGGYDIDQHGEIIIASLEGSRTNVMGLPEEVVKEKLKIENRRNGSNNEKEDKYQRTFRLSHSSKS